MCTVPVHFEVGINKNSLELKTFTAFYTIYTQQVILPGSNKPESKMGILIKSMGVIQGYTIVAGLFETCENTETGLKLIEMDNSLHIWITVRKNQITWSNFMQNSVKNLPKNTIIYIKQQRFSFFFLTATSSPLIQDPTPT